jgi:hypothetical protein
MFLVLIFTRGWVDPRAMVRSERNISLKDTVTPPGIDPGTVRLVARRLNLYATPGPYDYIGWFKIDLSLDVWKHNSRINWHLRYSLQVVNLVKYLDLCNLFYLSNCNVKVKRRLREALLLRAPRLWNSQIFLFACLSYASSVGGCEFVRCAPAPMLRHAIGINERAENKSLWKITLGFVASITVNMIKVQNSHNEKHMKKRLGLPRFTLSCVS